MGRSGKSKRRIGAEARRRFLASVSAGRSLEAAAKAGGFSLSGFYGRRRRDAGFAAEWREALAESAALERSLVRPNGRRRLQRRLMRHVAFDAERQEVFLNHFAGGGDAREAAAVAGVDHSTVYKHRRKDPAFAAEFDIALDQAFVQLRVESVRQRLEAQKRLRQAVEDGIPTGEVAEEFERVLKLLDRWDRRNGQTGMRSIAPEKRRALSFDEAMALLDTKLRNLDIPVLRLPPDIAARYDGTEGDEGDDGDQGDQGNEGEGA